mgnify:CR=1 FL=1
MALRRVKCRAKDNHYDTICMLQELAQYLDKYAVVCPACLLEECCMPSIKHLDNTYCSLYVISASGRH